MRAQIKLHVKGPRWARSDKAIKNVCEDLGLECEVERTTFLLWETVYFKVEGRASRVDVFKRSFMEAVYKWNGEDSPKEAK